MEEDARKYFDRIEKIGGVVAGIEKGFFQKEIADASYRYVKEIERKDRVIVGVNEYRIPEPPPEILKIGPELEAKQLRRLRETKARRDAKRVETALNRLQAAQEKEGENLMPHLLEATRAYATLGELRAAMVEVFGEYREPSMF